MSRGPSQAGEPFDVAVVGAGVVGCAVARLLSYYNLRIVVIDAACDVGSGTSKANTAILHTGFDALPGSVEARLVARGYDLLSEYASSTGIALERTGALLVAWNDEQLAALPAIIAKAQRNGYSACDPVDAAEVYALEPNLGAGVLGGVRVPGEHIIDPWSVPLTLAREAVANGCELRLSTNVDGPRLAQTSAEVHDLGGGIQARFVVNAAGLNGDLLHRAFGFDGFTIRPRRGQLIVFDSFARRLLSHTILPVPTATTKGVLVAPTVFGNVMLGPTADDIDDRTATGTTRGGIDGLLAKGRAIMPALLDEEVTAVYAGLRPATEHTDYQLFADRDARYVCLGGIRSTGLTASMALAEETLAMLATCGLELHARTDERVIVGAPQLGELSRRPYEHGGTVVCHCARVTAEEITEACTDPYIAATTLDGLRRRTRVLTGRCQGFYCLSSVVTLAASARATPESRWIGAA